jgi:hypothetical protein
MSGRSLSGVECAENALVLALVLALEPHRTRAVVGASAARRTAFAAAGSTNRIHPTPRTIHPTPRTNTVGPSTKHVQLANLETRGRILEATQACHAGQEVLREEPVVIFPYSVSSASAIRAAPSSPPHPRPQTEQSPGVRRSCRWPARHGAAS